MTVTVTQLSPHIGAELTGLSGRQFDDQQVADECLRLLEENGVLVYRDANLSDEDLVGFSRLLGQIVIQKRGTDETHPEISKITRDPARSSLAAYQEGTFFWHIDGATDPEPNKATLLSAIEITEDGSGDTEFASTYAAYQALPEAEKTSLDSVRVKHSFAAAQMLARPDSTEAERDAWRRAPAREHPLVWSRRNGRRSMLLGATAESVVDRPGSEGRQLLDRLLEWATQPQFVLRHHWRRGDLVIWDNTGMLHRALHYEAASPRYMHRTTIRGEETVA